MVSMYAVGATYRDPVTPSTTDVQAVADQTYRVFPDWRQQIERIRGGDDWAVFEWSGSGTYRGPGAEDGPGFPVRIEGATIVEVNDDGLITAWRDFPDVYASTQQITAGLLAVGGTPPARRCDPRRLGRALRRKRPVWRLRHVAVGRARLPSEDGQGPVRFGSTAMLAVPCTFRSDTRCSLA